MPNLKLVLLTTLLLTPAIFCVEDTPNDAGVTDEEIANLTKSDDNDADEGSELQEFFSREAFLESYNDAKSTHQEVVFIREYFPNQDTVLLKADYETFLVKYLDLNLHELDIESQEVLEAAAQEHKLLIEQFIIEKEEKNGAKENYGFETVLTDLIDGELLNFVHEHIDHGGDHDEL